MKRIGFQSRLGSHGFRSMEIIILNEHGWGPELVEIALAHVDKDEVRSAYNRADYITDFAASAWGTPMTSAMRSTAGPRIPPSACTG
jgi:hypothetical protein